MPKISVIVPVYKVESYLSRCVDSILAQNFTDFELILVDDGSPDGCGTICDRYTRKDVRILVIHHRNGGLSAARNSGIDWAFVCSDSEWITFVDSDDWIHPLYLEALWSAVYKTGMTLGLCGIIKTSSPGTEHLKGIHYKTVDSKTLYYGFLNELLASISACAKLYSKDCFRKIRFPVGKQWEDLRTTFKPILEAKKCAVIKENLYYYYINPEGTVRRTWRPDRIDELEAYEYTMECLKQNPSWSELYIAMQACYIRAISYSYYMEQNSDLPMAEKRYYARLLQRKERFALRKYRKSSGIRFRDHRNVYETAFPTAMKYYWIVLSQLEKVRKWIK